LTSYCADTTFFNTILADKVTFEISPQLVLKPSFRVQPISSSQLRITIPKEEQYKFEAPITIPKDGYKIIVGIKLTNKVY
jgi:hypothetical protein